MKTHLNFLFLLPALLAGLGLLLAGRVTAQTFTTLHSFTSLFYSNTNSDGANPHVGLILSGNKLYGTTVNGGFYHAHPYNTFDFAAAGTIFAVNTDGTGFTNI